jgi:hypothetical protein
MGWTKSRQRHRPIRNRRRDVDASRRSSATFRLGRPPEQPSDDGAQELARRALSVIEGRGHRREGSTSRSPRERVSLWRRACGRSMTGSMRFKHAATRVLRLQRCKRESAPAIGRTGAPLVLRVAEPELAREPRTPGAGRQGSSAQARRLHELRSEFRFTGLAKKIRMTLAVIPQMRLRKHGSLPSTSRTRSRGFVFLAHHNRERSIDRSYGPVGPGSYTVKVQYGLPFIGSIGTPSFSLSFTHLTVEAAGCPCSAK